MAERDAAQQLIGDFGRTVGIEDLALDEANYCCLVIDQDLVINIELDEPGRRLMLYSIVGRLPGEGAVPRLTELMQANYLGRGTDGATLGLQPDSAAVVLSRELPIPRLDVPAFNAALERFVNTVEDWTRRLAAPPDQPASEPDVMVPQGGIRV